MRPYKYTKQGNKTIFHYHYRDLRNFLEHGFKHGDNGFIIVSEENGFIKHKGFGTIENPRKTILTMVIQHCEPFDGEYCPDLSLYQNY